MSLAEEIRLVAQHELKKNLRSTKGIVMFVLFFLGGAVPVLLQIWIQRMAKEAHFDKIPPEEKHRLFEQALLRGYHGDHDIATYLSHSPPLLYFLLSGTQLVLPLLCLIVGFDQVAGEVQHRSIRYLVGRANRASLVVGKALGIWGVIGVMILVLHAVVWVMLLATGDESAAATLSWGVRFWAFSLATAGASVGLASLVSSLFKVPILALFIGIATAFGLFLARLIVLAIGDSADFAKWIFPATYESFMVKPDVLSAVGGCAAAIGWGALLVGLATLIVQRKDV